MTTPSQPDSAAPWGRGEDGRPCLPMGKDWTDIPELVDQQIADIQTRVGQASPGHWYRDQIPGSSPDGVSTRDGGVNYTVGRISTSQPADLDFILHAHSDVSWCLDTIAKARARVAELEAELRIGLPWTCDACGKENTRDVCAVCETDRPDPE